MDYHDLSTKLYSPWGYPKYHDYLPSQYDAIFVEAKAGIRTAAALPFEPSHFGFKAILRFTPSQTPSLQYEAYLGGSS